MWERDSIAARVVRVCPDSSWIEDPEVIENDEDADTEFEKAWKDLDDEHHILTELENLDTISGIGTFGTMFVGIDDGLEPHEPIEGISDDPKSAGTSEHSITFLRSFEEGLVMVDTWNRDIQSPRYGRPEFYRVKFVETNEHAQDQRGASPQSYEKRVHWSRMIHYADQRTNSLVFGTPRMRTVYNRLLDARKIAGGSAEMFWKGGFPGLSFETQPGISEDLEIDIASLREQVRKYEDGLQRSVFSEGMTANSLTSSIADPSSALEAQLKLIALGVACPYRQFIGSEQAQLASGQDAVYWRTAMNKRNRRQVVPRLVVPFARRLVQIGVLPEPSDMIKAEFPDMNSPTDKDKAEVARLKMEAISKYLMSSAKDELMRPFHFFTEILNMNDELAREITDDLEEQFELEEKAIGEARTQMETEMADRAREERLQQGVEGDGQPTNFQRNHA